MKKLIPALAVMCLTLQAQTPALATFEAASIHLSEPGQPVANFHTDPGSLSTRNVTLRTCIEWAYGLRTLQIAGPVWLSDVRVDITARAEDRNADDDKLRPMLQALLAERFGMKAHREQKEEQVYALTVAKGGPKFHAKGAKDSSAFAKSTTNGESGFSEDKTGAIGTRVSMYDVANKLSQLVNRIVIDKTGLEGSYDFRLDLVPYMAMDGEGKADIMSIIFAGFNDQLGLKLEPEKESVELLAIDSINRIPTEN